MTELDVVSRTPQEWADVVRTDLGHAVVGFVSAGRHLIEAQREIGKGMVWETWLREQVGISQSTGSKLMAIADHPIFLDHSHVNDLPPSWGTLYELTQLEPEWLERALTAGRITPELERKEARALVVEYKQIAAQVAFDVRHGDFREQLDDIEPGTLDAVITDPPYPAEYLPLYADLAAHAAKWLRPGGVCAVMSGQSWLPEVVQHLGTHLDYQWTVAYLTPGGQAVQVFPRKVNTFWKPVLVYSNGPRDGEWYGDVARSDTNDNDKTHHHWGQSESGMADLVRRLTRPGDRICDPFAGAGTTGVVALALGRSFIGCDVDADHVTTMRERLEQAVLDRLG